MNKATQKMDFLRGSRTNLECYNDGRLVNYGSIKLRLQHYLDKSFQDHYFYVVETKTPKEIIVGHPASTRLGLICVLCKNVSKSVLAIENKTNTSSRDSFQDHCLKIDGKPPQRKQRSKSESFQDHSSTSFKTMAKSAQSESSFKTLDQDTGKSLLSRPSAVKSGKKEPKMAGSFKTIEDGSQKLTSFKTISDRVKNLNPRYMVPVHEVSQVISDPQTAKMAQPVKDQPLSGPPPKGSRFNPSMWSQVQQPLTVPGIFKHCFPTALTALVT